MAKLNTIHQEFEKLNINVHKFDHINVILIIIASIVASVGLLTNNYQSVIASKIIGLALIPFLSFAILLFTLDTHKILQSSVTCIIFIAVCLSVSMLIGMYNSHNQYVEELTPEMLSRANFKYENIYLELIMSFIAGIGIFYAIIKNSVVALIGLIFVISIIPAISNSGLFYGMAFYEHFIKQDPNINKKKLYIDYGHHSMALFISNIIGVIIGFTLMVFLNYNNNT
jgi:hypothetical protein